MSLPSKLIIVAGARPNFMKIAPIIRELVRNADAFQWSLVHTGQHYDREMSDVFFDELGIPKPDFHLEAGGGSHAEQTAKIMMRFEEVCAEVKPDLVMVVGDVNSTLAAAIVAKKQGVRVAHVEAGLRSGDMSMPEEINRIVTDSISDYFFVTEPSGETNLLKEGHLPEQIFFVGHVMIDNLFYQLHQLGSGMHKSYETQAFKTMHDEYGVVTLHRPSNVDEPESLRRVVAALNAVAELIPLIFVVHPRTAANLSKYGIQLGTNVHLSSPLPYMEFLNLWKDARLVLTDSGGLQEETTALGIPCITLRSNTERPVTVTEGSNVLVGNSAERILEATRAVLSVPKEDRVQRRPKLWDGEAATRIVSILKRALANAANG